MLKSPMITHGELVLDETSPKLSSLQHRIGADFIERKMKSEPGRQLDE